MEGDEAVTKLDPAVEGIYKNIAKQYESGRVAVMSDVELLNMLIDHKPELAEKAKTHLP